MKNTSLCYLERGGQYLMLHRVKKENDENKDKWIGIGGKFEPGESPEDCVCREVLEETAAALEDAAAASEETRERAKDAAEAYFAALSQVKALRAKLETLEAVQQKALESDLSLIHI